MRQGDRTHNERPGVDAGWRVLFAFQRPRPRATQAGRSTCRRELSCGDFGGGIILCILRWFAAEVFVARSHRVRRVSVRPDAAGS
jgi:hypothetical protein